jgi:hypothetical protein
MQQRRWLREWPGWLRCGSTNFTSSALDLDLDLKQGLFGLSGSISTGIGPAPRSPQWAVGGRRSSV